MSTAEAINLVLNLLPELVLLFGGAVLLVALPGRRDEASPASAYIAVLAVAASAVAMHFIQVGGLSRPGPGSAIVIDATATAGRWAALMVGILLIGANFALPRTVRTPDGNQPRPRWQETDRAAPEFFMLLLFSLAGLMLTAIANDLIVLFLALELASVPTIVAVALSRPAARATESAGKYFYLSAFTTAILLMGLAYLFGLTGQTRLDSPAWSQAARAGLLATVGLGLAAAGLAFKIAAFPFHTYLADIYEGAAAPVAGWLGFVPKAAGFIALAKLVAAVDPASVGGPEFWKWTVWALAAATMTAGNVLALVQKNVKRLLAYSSVAHSGYLLVALLIAPEIGRYLPIALLFYVVAYGLANLGAFMVLADGGGEAETFGDLHGLSRTNLPLAIAMSIFAFSLMGLPPLLGFIAKIYVFVGAFQAGYVWLVVVALVNSAIAAAYYLRLIGACWTDRKKAPAEPPGKPLPAAGLVIAVLAVLTVAAGLFPVLIRNRLTWQPGPKHEIMSNERMSNVD